MYVSNFTPDEIKWVHVGITGVLNPGEVKEFDEARGNHILNKYGARGLLRMQYGDDQEIKKVEAMGMFREFWLRQITTFNQLNEARKNENRPYAHPTKELEEHAEMLGVEILGPWKIVQKTDSAEVADLKKENRELKEHLDRLTTMVEELAGGKDAKRRRFKMLTKQQLMPWVFENMPEIEKDWDDDIRGELAEKWGKFYEDPFPIPAK